MLVRVAHETEMRFTCSSPEWMQWAQGSELFYRLVGNVRQELGVATSTNSRGCSRGNSSQQNLLCPVKTEIGNFYALELLRKLCKRYARSWKDY